MAVTLQHTALMIIKILAVIPNIRCSFSSSGLFAASTGERIESIISAVKVSKPHTVILYGTYLTTANTTGHRMQDDK